MGPPDGPATTDTAIRFLEAWNWGRLTGHCLPTARGANLDPATDWMTWGFLYDDQFAGPLGNQPARVARITENMIGALHATSATPGKTPARAASRTSSSGSPRRCPRPGWPASATT
ncbi:hypothetical protein ACN28S_11680 [Cystobacter fuscus]